MTSEEKNRSVHIVGANDEHESFGGHDVLEAPRHFFDASLLFQCMDRLQIDQAELANGDPLLFRELQGMCALCRAKEQCARDLAHQLEDAGWDRWWAYCPNSAMLTMIAALQNCGRAAQHLKPLPASLSQLR